MKRRTLQALLSSGALLLALLVASHGWSQPMRPRLPVPTTMILALPAPDKGYGNKQVITIGVGRKVYKFVVIDAWVTDGRTNWQWIDVWQLVSQYPVMMRAMGQNMDTFEKIDPGSTYTVMGLFSPANRVFEVMSFEQGSGPYAPSEKY